jgi:nicotinate-nucleotide adenylyltransferase
MKKIGVIAGAFDPIHSGHINFIDSSIKKYSLDKVFIIIEKESRFKQSFAEFSHRKKIVELSIKNKPEVELYQALSPSFPLSSTLPNIKYDFQDAKIYLLIGDDVKEHIKTWPNAEKLFQGVEYIVTKRKNGLGKYSRVSSGKVREQIKNGAVKADLGEEALDYCKSNNLYR